MYRNKKSLRFIQQLIFILFLGFTAIYFFFVVPDYFDGSWDFVYLCLTDFVVFLSFRFVFSPLVFKQLNANLLIALSVLSVIYLFILAAIIGLSWAFGGLQWSTEGWDIRNFWTILTTFLLPSVVGILLYSWAKGLGQWALIKDSEIKYRDLEKESNVLKAQLLQQKIPPHFMNGTLTIIAPLIQKRPVDALKAIDLFNRIIKHYLKFQGDKLVDFASELEQVEYMRQIYELRKNKTIRLKIDLQVEDDRQVRIPPMVLISLVENAFQYGNLGREEDPVTIRLECGSASTCKLHVTNPIYLKRKPSPGMGSAQKYIRDLLKLLDPEDSEMATFIADGHYHVYITFNLNRASR